MDITTENGQTGGIAPGSITAYEPEYQDLWFKQRLLADAETMSYNHAWGGTVSFPEEKWAAWYDRWILHTEEKRYYRYLKNEEDGFIGEMAYHLDDELGVYLADVIIYAKFRGRGYGTQSLAMLCAAAKARGISVLYDDIAPDNPAISLFLKQGFSEDYRTDDFIMLKKEL